MQADKAKNRSTMERELATVNMAIERTISAIQSPGGQIPSLVESLGALERQRERILAQLSAPTGEVVELHPHAARRYRQIIESFSASLAEGGPAAAKAMELVRSLITRVRIIPTARRQPVGIQIEGNLLALIDEKGELRHDPAGETAAVAISV